MTRAPITALVEEGHATVAAHSSGMRKFWIIISFEAFVDPSLHGVSRALGGAMQQPMRVMRSVLVVLLLSACASHGPHIPAVEINTLAIGGHQSIRFLPPIGAEFHLSGNFDPDVDLHIELFDRSTGEPVASFSVVGGDIRVTNDPGVEEQYHVNWDTRSAGLPNGSVVRIEVRLPHAEPASVACGAGVDLVAGCLAFVDVQLLQNRGRAGGRAAGEFVDLVNGHTLPIKLHILADLAYLIPGPDGSYQLRASVAPIPGSQAADLVVVDPIAEIGYVPSSGRVIFSLPDAHPAIVAVMDAARDFGWMALSPTWFSRATAVQGASTLSPSTGVVGPLSTAVTMLFFLPDVFSLNTRDAELIVTALLGVPEVHAFADVLLEQAAEAALPLEAPEVKEAFLAAYAAAVPVLADLAHPNPVNKASTAGPVRASLGISYTNVRLDREWVVLYLNELAEIEAMWGDPGHTEPWEDVLFNRAGDWIGYVYQVDPAAYGSFNELHLQWKENPWRSDITLTSTTPVGSLHLEQDNFFSRFSLSYLYDVAVAATIGSSSTFAVPKVPAVYAIHMHTCSRSNTMNAQLDRTLIGNWPGAADAQRDACVLAIVSLALDAVSLVNMDVINTVFLNAANAALVRQVATRLLDEAGGIESMSIAAFRAAVTEVAAVVLDLATEAVSEVGRRSLIWSLRTAIRWKVEAVVGVAELVTGLGEILTRLRFMNVATPWEAEAVRIGDPWAGSDFAYFTRFGSIGTVGVYTDELQRQGGLLVATEQSINEGFGYLQALEPTGSIRLWIKNSSDSQVSDVRPMRMTRSEDGGGVGTGSWVVGSGGPAFGCHADVPAAHDGVIEFTDCDFGLIDPDAYGGPAVWFVNGLSRPYNDDVSMLQLGGWTQDVYPAGSCAGVGCGVALDIYFEFVGLFRTPGVTGLPHAVSDAYQAD